MFWLKRRYRDDSAGLQTVWGNDKVYRFRALEERRNKHDLIEVYNTFNGLPRVKVDEMFTLDGNNY